MFNDDMLIDTPDDMVIDDYAEDIEVSVDDVIDNDGSDIDMIANITDEDLRDDYDDEEEDSYEDEYYDDDEDHVDYIVSNNDDDESIKNDILTSIKNEEE